MVEVAERRAGDGVRAWLVRVDDGGGGEGDGDEGDGDEGDDDEGDDDEGVVVAHLAYAPRLAPPPPDGAAFWRHVRSASLVYTSDPSSSHGVALDGSGIVVDADAFSRVPASEWAAEHARRARHLQRKCARLPTRFRVATRDALFRWTESYKKLVRVASGDGGGDDERVGLLVGIDGR